MKKTLLLGLAGLILIGCKKKDPEASLPAATQIGANTGGYLLNGQAITANDIPGSNGILSSTKPILGVAGGFLNDTTIVVNLNGLQDSQRYYLLLFVRYHGLGMYRFNQNTSLFNGADHPSLKNHALFSSWPRGGATTPAFMTDSLHTGTLTLDYADRINGILAGRFEFSAGNNQAGTVQVTQGRFDFKE